MLLDIALAAKAAQDFAAKLSDMNFEFSRLHQNAVVRSLEVIGEAVSKLSVDFKVDHPGFQWGNNANMRHRIVYDFNGLYLDIVWTAVKK